MNRSHLVLFLVVFIDLLGFGIMIPMLPFLARSFEASAFEIGLLMFAYSFVQIFVSPFWGSLSDRLGRKNILLITILGQAIAMLLGGLSQSYLQLLLSRVLAGFFAANISVASAFMADITPAKERAKGMGLIGAAFGLGFIAGPAIGGAMSGFHISAPMMFSATLGAINFILGYFILPKLSKDQQKERAQSVWKHFKFVWSHLVLRKAMIIFFILTFAFVQLEVTFGLFVADQFGWETKMVGYMLALMGITMAIVQGGLIGRLSKKYHERTLIQSGAILLLLGLLGLAISHQEEAVLICMISLGLGYSLLNPCLSALFSKEVPENQLGGYMGLYQSTGSLARVLAPLTAGLLYDQSKVGPFWLGIFGMVIVWVLASNLRRSQV